MLHPSIPSLAAAGCLLFCASAGAGASTSHCQVPRGGPQKLYARNTTCRTATRVQRTYVRVLGDCGNHVCAFFAAGRDWVCHDRAHPGYLQITCVADTNHARRVGWRDAEY
jgi:hypothetical protein